MKLWFNTYFDTIPSTNARLNAWYVDFDNYSISLDTDIFQSPLAQAILAVKNITDQYDGPYTLLASGGIDSQAMIWAWEKSGEDYKIVHYDYCGWNYHDSEHLLKFLQKNKLEHKLTVKTFDAMSYIASPELIENAKEFDCSSPQILTYIKFAQQTPGTIIQAGNYISKSVAGLNYTLMALQRYADTRPNYVPFFFQSFPSLAYAFITTDFKYNSLAVKNMDIGYDAKNKTYLETGFPVLRQPGKYTGFEKIKAFFDSESVSTLDKIKWQNQPSKRPFDILFRYKLYDHIGLYNDKTIIKHHSMVNNLLLGE